MRERIEDEIIPIGAENSRTKDDNEEDYAANHALDLNLDTKSFATQGPDGTTWIKVKLDKVTCIHQVRRFSKSGGKECTWTCTGEDCLDHEGPSHCEEYLLTTSIERTSLDDLPPIESSCRYGDTVKLQRNRVPGDADGDLSYYVREIAITGKPVEMRSGK